MASIPPRQPSWWLRRASGPTAAEPRRYPPHPNPTLLAKITSVSLGGCGYKSSQLAQPWSVRALHSPRWMSACIRTPTCRFSLRQPCHASSAALADFLQLPLASPSRSRRKRTAALVRSSCRSLSPPDVPSFLIHCLPSATAATFLSRPCNVFRCNDSSRDTSLGGHQGRRLGARPAIRHLGNRCGLAPRHFLIWRIPWVEGRGHRPPIG